MSPHKLPSAQLKCFDLSYNGQVLSEIQYRRAGWLPAFSFPTGLDFNHDVIVFHSHCCFVYYYYYYIITIITIIAIHHFRFCKCYLFFFLFSDEREDVQKKTFGKWINSQLAKVLNKIKSIKKKTGISKSFLCHLKVHFSLVTDLFYDLRDGTRLLALLGVLTGRTYVSYSVWNDFIWLITFSH